MFAIDVALLHVVTYLLQLFSLVGVVLTMSVLTIRYCICLPFQNTSVATYYTRAHKVSPNCTSCELPLTPLDLYTNNHFYLVRPANSDFFQIPPGGATQYYDIAVSNDDTTFTDEQRFTVYDGICMNCYGSNCTQRVTNVKAGFSHKM